MNTPYTVLELALEQDSVAIAHLGLAIFDQYDVVVDPDISVANNDPFEKYENLYLVPS